MRTTAAYLPPCTTINKDASKSQKSMTVWHDYLHRHHHDHHNILLLMMIHMYIGKFSQEKCIHIYFTHAAEILIREHVQKGRKEKYKYASSFCLLPIFVHACEKKIGWACYIFLYDLKKSVLYDDTSFEKLSSWKLTQYLANRRELKRCNIVQVQHAVVLTNTQKSVKQ